MWLEENLGSRMNIHRVQQAVDNKSDTVCVSCPYCLTMFEDGVKDIGSEKLKVKDIAELLMDGRIDPEAELFIRQGDEVFPATLKVFQTGHGRKNRFG